MNNYQESLCQGLVFNVNVWLKELTVPVFCILFTTWTGGTQRVVIACHISVRVWRGPEVSEEENMNSVNSSHAWQQDNTGEERTCKMKLLFHRPWRMLSPTRCLMLKLIIWFPNLEDVLYILVEVNIHNIFYCGKVTFLSETGYLFNPTQ